jgi:hypothetical protein
MPSVADLYSLYLRAEHLPPDKVIPVVIERCSLEELHPKPGQTAKRLVLAFKGKSRRLVVNNSNAGRLADIGGEDYTAWPGLVIGLKRVKYTKDQDTIVIVAAPTNGGAK